MKTAIVTGATSMLGIATINELINNNVKVFAISRKNSNRKDKLPKSNLIIFIEADLSELKNIDLNEKCDVFYHFGWAFTDKKTRDDPTLQLKNIKYTLDAVNLAKAAGCRRFLGAGSQAEYGFKTEITTEDAKIEPTSSYGYCKYAAGKLSEKLCLNYGIEHIWMRIFSVYGENDSPNTLLSYAVNKFLNNEIAEFSSGTQMWNFLNAKDAAVYFYLLGNISLKQNEVVNVCSGDTRELKDYFNEMKYIFDSIEKGKFQYVLSINDSLNSIFPSNEKLVSITGYVPKVNFTEGFKELLLQQN